MPHSAEHGEPASEHDQLDPLTHLVNVAHRDADELARARAGRAIRDLGHAIVGHYATVDEITEIADTLNAFTARLDANRVRNRREHHHGDVWGEAPGDGEIMTSYPERPVSGDASPWGLDTLVRREGDEAVALVTLRPAHEGAPERSHGGIVAALFDDIYGFVLAIHLQPAFTGEISVRYRAGTPIGVPLECRVRLAERQGRKLLMTGELTVVETGEVLVTSTATFIAIDIAQFLSPGT